MKLLGGEIILSSEPNHGSEFALIIPVTKAIQPEISIQPIAVKNIVEPGKLENKYLSTHIPENIPDDRNEITKNDKSILIIEDDVHFGKSLLEFARKKGYKGMLPFVAMKELNWQNNLFPLEFSRHSIANKEWMGSNGRVEK